MITADSNLGPQGTPFSSRRLAGWPLKSTVLENWEDWRLECRKNVPGGYRLGPAFLNWSGSTKDGDDRPQDGTSDPQGPLGYCCKSRH